MVGVAATKDEEPGKAHDGGVTVKPEDHATEEAEVEPEMRVVDDGQAKEEAPKATARRSPAASAALVVVRLTLTAAACYLIYLLFHYTMDEAFEAAHPVLHWIIS